MNSTPIHLDRLSRALHAEGVRLSRTRLLAVAAAAFGCRNVHELSALDRRGDLSPLQPADLGLAEVPHVGAMRFLRDPSGYVYAIQPDALASGDRARGWHLAPMGGLALVDAGEQTPARPESLGTHDPDTPYLLTDSSCEHVGGYQADVQALGRELGTFANHFYPLDEEEARYVSEDEVVSTSRTASVRTGYSAMLHRTKHVAPTAEFRYDGGTDDDPGISRTDALAEARAFVDIVRPRVAALGGEIFLQEDSGDVYGDPAHTVMILVPMSVAMASGSPTEWWTRLADVIDMPSDEPERPDIRVEGEEFAVELEYIGEGEDGDYDPADPDDQPLYRFSVERKVDGEWEYVEDSSYCTQINADISRTRAEAAARFLLARVEQHGGPYLKRLCEGLSWISIADVEEQTSSH